MPAFNIGSWIPGTIHACTNIGTWNYTAAGVCSFKTLTTTIEAILYDADGVTQLANHTTAAITGNIDATINNIRIRVTGWAPEVSRYKGLITVDYFVSSIIPFGGRCSIKIIHHNAGTDYTKTQNDIFYDPNTNAATQLGLTIAETAGQVQTMHLSGVEYYAINSQFTVDIADLDYLNDSSYPLTQVELVGPEYGLPNINIIGTDLTGWTNIWDNINSSYNKINWAVTAINYFILTSTGNISSRTVDWVASSWLDSINSKIGICTYTDNSTRIYEDFRLETNRLLSDLLTSWDSTQFLTTYDTSTGLQFFNSRLIYPTINFGLINPNPGTQPNYGIFTSDGLFYRRMWHTGTSHSNGLFQLSDYNITEAEFTSKDVIIELSLDGIAWFILNDLYPGGAIGNGDGCRINETTYGLIGSIPNNNQLQFTFGTGKFTDVTTGGGWGVYIKITYKDNPVGRSKYLGVLQITNWV